MTAVIVGIIALLVGAILGFIGGVLVYRKNSKMIEPLVSTAEKATKKK